MDDRKIKILNSIISSYLDSKEPVGSRSLSKDFDIGFSAATIRNEMSDLEDLGYLQKIHSSSGRIPSNRGYRLYVDSLLSDDIPFRNTSNQLFDMRKLKESNDFENIIKNATKILSAVTNYTSIALVPELEDIYLKYINVVMLSPRDLAIIYIYNSKEVYHDILKLKTPVYEETIKIVNSILSSTLIDLNCKQILEMLQSSVYRVLKLQHHVLNEIIPFISKMNISKSEPKIIYEGLGNIYTFNKESIESNNKLINFIKDDSSILELLSKNMDTNLQVYIGEEIGLELLNNFSIVTMTFRNKDGVNGKIGILGPNSMKYDKVISDIFLVSRYINGHIEKVR